jgi:hypothetical protein
MAQLGHSQSSDSTPKFAVKGAPEMEVVPENCGQLAKPMVVDPMIDGIGAWPIWVALPNWSNESEGVLIIPNERDFKHPEMQGWWSMKVAWFIPLSYTGEVRLRGYNLADDSPIYFEFQEGLTDVATLNPAQPGGLVEGLDQWAFFPSHVSVPRAGCYRLQAEWDGGLWEQTIAVGSRE